MSEQSDEQPKTFKVTTRPLDRNNLPDEFTSEFLERIPIRDVIWLERDADLTPRQRESFQAWTKDRFKTIRTFGGVGESTRHIMEGFKLPSGAFSNWFTAAKPFTLGRSADPLGADIQKTMRELADLTGPPNKVPLDHAKRRHDEQQESLRQLHEATEAMRELMVQLVARTEQQHQAAERQKTTNWALAVIAAASMAGTFATVNSMTHFWLALITTVLVGGVLYVAMH
jgi:hypothetical protein